jgi:hypothetical protein
MRGFRNEVEPYLFAFHTQPFQHTIKMDLLNRLLPLLAERKVSQEDRTIKAQRIHVLTGRCIHLPCPSKHRALCLRLSRRINIRHPHQFQQPLTLRVVLPCDSNRASREFLHLFRCSSLLGLLSRLISFGFPLEALG